VLELLDLRDRRERLEPRRLEIDPSVSEAVRGIVERVRAEGDAALVALTRRFDGVDLSEGGLLVSLDEFERAEQATPPDLRAALDSLIERLTEFHARQLPQPWTDVTAGVRFGEIVRPVRSAGCYVPGGRAVYPSSVAMTVVPAVVAGVEEIVVCSPPRADGTLPDAVAYAALKAGATSVVKVGGAQAIAALAYGVQSVPAVDRIVGPGNVYVTEAKRQVAGTVGIDGLAGPTELVIVADASADPALLAVDLVSQAEHDPDASTTLVTTDRALLDSTAPFLESEVAQAARREVVEASLAKSRAVVVLDEDQAAEVVNDLAPEHLEVLIPNARAFVEKVRNAGAIFLGEWTAVPFGDYGVASNHVLPTAGTARFASGLRAADFVTISSVTEMDQSAVERFAPETAAIAKAESFAGHARAMEFRAERQP